jgi:hypothetical protein
LNQVAATATGVCKRAVPTRPVRLRACVRGALRAALDVPRITPTASSMASPVPPVGRLKCLYATSMLIQPAGEPYTAQ